MPAIRARPLPEDSLLARHSRPGDHNDFYTIDVPGAVGLEAFVEAFYTSRGFLPERLFLYLLGRGASAGKARLLAHSETERFAAWQVEHRTECELLLQDYLGRTRSWLSVKPRDGGGTRLSFGSGIIRDCQDFRVRAGIMGEKESHYVPTQRACDTERAS